ncbi:hypothetical protein GQ54DRAFT_145064 [Martensiomyces pterosporus]|nr:hypothetical protein GQ54DRAFT_145064 [Martensiomyces pterosporus]
MSYVDFGKALAQRAWAAAEFVHQHAFPLCGDLVLRSGEQWGPFNAILNVVGATTLTYMLEAFLVYAGARIAIFTVRLFSDTLYRMLRFALAILVISAGVFLGLYLYFTSTPQGQDQARSAGGSFWVDQALGFASRLAPMWDSTPGRRHGTNAPPPINFQYQPGR